MQFCGINCFSLSHFLPGQSGACGPQRYRVGHEWERRRAEASGEAGSQEQGPSHSVEEEAVGELAWDAFWAPFREATPSAPGYTPSNAPTVPEFHLLEGTRPATPADVTRLRKVVSPGLMQDIERGRVTVASLEAMPGIEAVGTLERIEERDESGGRKAGGKTAGVKGGKKK